MSGKIQQIYKWNLPITENAGNFDKKHHLVGFLSRLFYKETDVLINHVYVVIPIIHTWRVQMQKPLSAIWNFLLEWSFLSNLYI